MFDAGILGGACSRCRLLKLVGAFFPDIGDQKNAVRPVKCSSKGLQAVYIRFDDFLGELAMRARTLNWLPACRARSTAPPWFPVAPITAISFLSLDAMVQFLLLTQSCSGGRGANGAQRRFPG